MNYYPFHLGDYAAHTAHLDLMEDLAYRRMLDLYYRTEEALPNSPEDIGRLIRMRDNLSAIRDILNEFFTPSDSGWAHGRCEAEIAKMQEKQRKAKASAEISASVRSANAKRTLSERSTNAKRTLSERSTNVELPTPTPTPTPTPKTKEGSRAVALSFPDDVSPEVWADWVQLRKAKKAPVTGTVLQSARAEAAKAGLPLEQFLRVWCMRGSTGLQADWLKPHERAGPSVTTEPAWRSEQRERMAQFAPGAVEKRGTPSSSYTETLEASDGSQKLLD